MRRTLVWIIFVVCVLVAVHGLYWMTIRERATEKAREDAVAKLNESNKQLASTRDQIEVQKRLSGALWRLDSLLTPLIAQESTRNFSAYAAGTKQGEKIAPGYVSPLFARTSIFVRFHFQMTKDNQIESPQMSTASRASRQTNAAQQANGYAQSLNEKHIEDLRDSVQFDSLVNRLPKASTGVTEAYLNDTNAFDYAGLKDRNSSLHIFGNTSAQSYDPDELPLRSKSTVQVAHGVKGMRVEPWQTDNSPRLIKNNEEQSQEDNGSAYVLDFQQRGRNYELFANNFLRQQFAQEVSNSNRINMPAELLRGVGVTKALWVNDDLFLVRRCEIDGEDLIQGCWLNWPELRRQMVKDIADIFPDAELIPIKYQDEFDPAVALATLPVRIDPFGRTIVTKTSVAPQSKLWNWDLRSRLGVSVYVLLAWFSMGAAVIAVGLVLFKVSQLSERRAMFVSAVTHELRTPLTTFCMYTEMLASGMVPSDSATEYYGILGNEAKRLRHMVDNVLAFSRLERGRSVGERKEHSIPDLVMGMIDRLIMRAEAAGMQLDLQMGEEVKRRTIVTDPLAVEQILFNLIDNACKYASDATKREIHLRVAITRGMLEIHVQDFGNGIASRERRSIFRPFSKSSERAAETAPGIGLGLPLSKRLANELGGKLVLEKTGGTGTTFILRLELAS